MSKILIVEDDTILLKALNEALKNGDQILSEVDGNKAFQRVKEERPDLVLLDLFLPGKPGEVILAEIRGDAEIKDTPVLVATVKADEESRLRCNQLGVDGYFIKAHHSIDNIVEEAKKILGR